MIKARASGSKVYPYFMKKGRQARRRIPRNSCYVMGKALSGELSCPCDMSCLLLSFEENKA